MQNQIPQEILGICPILLYCEKHSDPLRTLRHEFSVIYSTLVQKYEFAEIYSTIPFSHWGFCHDTVQQSLFLQRFFEQQEIT